MSETDDDLSKLHQAGYVYTLREPRQYSMLMNASVPWVYLSDMSLVQQVQDLQPVEVAFDVMKGVTW